MKKTLEAGCLILLWVTVGCAHIPFLGKPAQPSTTSAASDEFAQVGESNRFVEKGKIIDAASLKEGKKVAVIPFKAGVNVEANDTLDRIALMIVKGIADTFANDPDQAFRILTVENSQEADLIIEGHVAGVAGPSRLKRWVMLKGHKRLSVEGKVVKAGRGETVAVFTDEKTSKTEDYADLGYRIGQNIGLFVLSGADEFLEGKK